MDSGIRIAMIILTKHIPLHISMADNRVLVSHDIQPMTCYGCTDTGHLYQACSLRRRVQEAAPTSFPTSWADMAARGRERQRRLEDERGIALRSEQPELDAKDYEEIVHHTLWMGDLTSLTNTCR